MNIFESLKDSSVSEECLENIISIVEEIINEVTKEQRYDAALSSVSPRHKEVKRLEANPNSSSNEIQRAKRRLNQAKNIVNTEGEGGLVTQSLTPKILPNGSKQVTQKIVATPLNREGANRQDDYRAGNTISWTSHRKSLGEGISKSCCKDIAELVEEYINEVSDRYIKRFKALRTLRKNNSEQQLKVKTKGQAGTADDTEEVKTLRDQVAKDEHKIQVLDDKLENRAKAKEEEEKKIDKSEEN